MWQLACTVDHVRDPGDWYEYSCRAPLRLLVRGDDGALRAFQNVCLHRGNELCTASGSGRTELRCVYHRWCWDLEGHLREVPSRKGFGVLRNEELRAPGGAGRRPGAPLVFVNLDPERRAARRVPRRRCPTTRRGCAPTSTRARYVVTVPLPCNWKAAIDAFSETYHVQGIHRQMIAVDRRRRTRRRRLWERHGKLGQPYGVPSPRLRDGASDQEIWESFVRDAGRHASGKSGTEDPAGTRRSHAGESMRATAGAHDPRARGRDDGVDLATFDDAAGHRPAPVQPASRTSRPCSSPRASRRAEQAGRRRPTTASSTSSSGRAAPDDPPRDAPPTSRWIPRRPTSVCVFNQDIENLRRVQRGLHQPGFTHLTLSREEMRIESLHRNLERYLGIEPSEVTGG